MLRSKAPFFLWAVALVAAVGFVLGGCQPSKQYPDKVCVDGSNQGRYSTCYRYEMQCPKPLVIREEEDKTFICRMPEEKAQ